MNHKICIEVKHIFKQLTLGIIYKLKAKGGAIRSFEGLNVFE